MGHTAWFFSRFCNKTGSTKHHWGELALPPQPVFLVWHGRQRGRVFCQDLTDRGVDCFKEVVEVGGWIFFFVCPSLSLQSFVSKISILFSSSAQGHGWWIWSGFCTIFQWGSQKANSACFLYPSIFDNIQEEECKGMEMLSGAEC